MLRVGLTGGIASGKTTVAQFMTEMGCHVIPADPIAHALMEPGGAAYDDIVSEFGREILFPDGRVDRNRLAAIVFSNPEKLSRLNRITHPRVTELILRRLDELEQNEPTGENLIAVVEAALLVEAGFHRHLDRLVMVDCGRENQMARLMERGLSQEQAESRLAAQMPAEEKRRYAHYVIDSSGPREETRRQVERIVQELRSLAALGRRQAPQDAGKPARSSRGKSEEAR
jgi:dephospho-CoA kinase